MQNKRRILSRIIFIFSAVAIVLLGCDQAGSRSNLDLIQRGDTQSLAEWYKAVGGFHGASGQDTADILDILIRIESKLDAIEERLDDTEKR